MTNDRARVELDLLRDDVAKLKAAPLFPAPADVKSAVERTLRLLEHLLERAECDE